MGCVVETDLAVAGCADGNTCVDKMPFEVKNEVVDAVDNDASAGCVVGVDVVTVESVSDTLVVDVDNGAVAGCVVSVVTRSGVGVVIMVSVCADEGMFVLSVVSGVIAASSSSVAGLVVAVLKVKGRVSSDVTAVDVVKFISVVV